MNSIGSRLKAIAVTALFFALSAGLLLGVIWALDALPVSIPGGEALSRYSPNNTVAAVSDLRAIIALTSAFLVASALVLAIDTDYCDRMHSVFADVLLMMMAAMAGFVGGYWVILRLADMETFFWPPFSIAALLCPAIVFLVSVVNPQRIRGSFPLRWLTTVLLAVAGPVLLLSA